MTVLLVQDTKKTTLQIQIQTGGMTTLTFKLQALNLQHE